ncbi:uncharacterized protein LOC116109031 [Pistacia vera]|uniref:uncharacterized protein LOC116109031 n=1 Tax=Pistacia vera TaxID=55513 RepID=UPI001263C626|nr:uncharacterized protein LOC116109031 [Pistacia vera]
MLLILSIFLTFVVSDVFDIEVMLPVSAIRSGRLQAVQLLERCRWIRLSWKEVPLALVKRWWMNWLIEKDKFGPVLSWAQRVKIVVGATRELNIYMKSMYAFHMCSWELYHAPEYAMT